MKKALLTLLIIALYITKIGAQLNGDGYYRVQNDYTGRYVYVVDNKGSINTSTSSIDMRAISLWKDFEKASSDPATVIYIKNVKGAEYDLYAQNTSTYDITEGYHVKIRDNRNGTYWASGSAQGMTIYLADTETSVYSPDGFMGNGTGADRNWRIIPINQDNDKFFGVKGELSYNKKFYTTMYANFPFSTTTSNTKVYTVCNIKDNIAIIREESGDIAEGTPVIFECTSAAPIDNKLDIHSSTATIPKDNCLDGTYYCNSKNNLINRIENNKETMRVLGIMSNGKLGFITANCDYMPANKAYLVVPSGSAKEIAIMTEEDYQEQFGNQNNPAVPDGVKDIKITQQHKTGIYTILGVKVSDKAEDIESLPKGIYIINGKKYIK